MPRPPFSMVTALPWTKSPVTSGAKDRQRWTALTGGKTDFIQTTAVGERDRRKELRSTPLK